MGTCPTFARESKPFYIQKLFMTSKSRESLINFVAYWKGSYLRHWTGLKRSKVFSFTKPFLNFADLNYLAGTKMLNSSESYKLVNWICSVNVSPQTEIFRLNNKILWPRKYNVWALCFFHILTLLCGELSNFILQYALRTIAKNG